MAVFKSLWSFIISLTINTNIPIMKLTSQYDDLLIDFLLPSPRYYKHKIVSSFGCLLKYYTCIHYDTVSIHLTCTNIYTISIITIILSTKSHTSVR